MANAPEKYRQTLEAYIRAWATNDKDLLFSLFTEDGALEDPVGTPPFQGHGGIGRFWDFAHAASGRTLNPVLEEIRACGDQAILRFTMQVRAPAENAGVNLSIIEHVTFSDDGRITHLRAFWGPENAGKPDGLDLLVPDIEDAYE